MLTLWDTSKVDRFFNEDFFFKPLNPAANISRKIDGTYLIKLYVPGLDKEQISITTDGNILTVSGGSDKQHDKDVGEKVLYKEFSCEKFSRSWEMENIDPDKIQASLQGGILTVTVPQIASSKPRKIKVE